jgi:hypothetical protein
MFEFGLGDLVKDRVTGFTGVIMARTQWFNGCVRYLLQATALKPDGGTVDEHNFDEEQIELVEVRKVVPPAHVMLKKGKGKKGGPKSGEGRITRTGL